MNRLSINIYSKSFSCCVFSCDSIIAFILMVLQSSLIIKTFPKRCLVNKKQLKQEMSQLLDVTFPMVHLGNKITLIPQRPITPLYENCLHNLNTKKQPLDVIGGSSDFRGFTTIRNLINADHKTFTIEKLNFTSFFSVVLHVYMSIH